MKIGFYGLAFLLSLLFVFGCANLRLTNTKNIVKDLVFKSVDGTDLKGDLYLPESAGPYPAVVVVHGGGWSHRSGDMVAICHDLAEAGFAAFNITYRLAPMTHFPAPVQDVQDAIRWLKTNAPKYQINPEKIGGWGYSAGANLILLAGLDSDVGLKAIVSGGTPADLTLWPHSPLVENWIGHDFSERPDLWKNASPVNHVVATSPPVFLYHGEWDHLVELEQMKHMQAALEAKNRPVETYVASFQGHFGVYLWSMKSMDLGIEFLKKYLLN